MLYNIVNSPYIGFVRKTSKVGCVFGSKHQLKIGKNSPIIFRLIKKSVENLFSSYEILYFREEIEKDQKSSDSWKSNQYEHKFFIIARKN